MDVSVLLVGMIFVSYKVWDLMFRTYTNTVEPEALSHAYYLLKRTRKK